jgi:hypothetical protein
MMMEYAIAVVYGFVLGLSIRPTCRLVARFRAIHR